MSRSLEPSTYRAELLRRWLAGREIAQAYMWLELVKQEIATDDESADFEHGAKEHGICHVFIGENEVIEWLEDGSVERRKLK